MITKNDFVNPLSKKIKCTWDKTVINISNEPRGVRDETVHSLM